MSDRSSNRHQTLHAFFLAAKEKGLTEFQLRLINSKGRIEFCIRPQGHSEMSAEFEVRGNMVRATAKAASVIPITDDADIDLWRNPFRGGPRLGSVKITASGGISGSDIMRNCSLGRMAHAVGVRSARGHG
jgi:hypothetical protein